MDFSGEVAEWQRKNAEGKAGNSRRSAVIEALDVRGGNAYLDVGCGGGHLVQELGTAAGTKGRVVGIDPSRQMVENTRAICQSLSCVEVIEGNASEIPVEDAQFDGVAALQVYEYVEDVGSALAEARRVLKPGCPISIVSILWEHCRFYGAERGLNERMIEAWRAHCFHQMLPLELPPLLEQNGFGSSSRSNLSYLETAHHAGTSGYYVSKLIAHFAISQGVSEEDARVWLLQLEDANTEERFGFVHFPVLTVATAI